MLFTLLLIPAANVRAGTMASRVYHRERIIPALTYHLDDSGGVTDS